MNEDLNMKKLLVAYADKLFNPPIDEQPHMSHANSLVLLPNESSTAIKIRFFFTFLWINCEINGLRYSVSIISFPGRGSERAI